MTIITKPLSGEKKGDKLIVPLVEDNHLPTAPISDDVEGQNSNVVFLSARARRVSATTTICLILTSLVVVSIGIFGGQYLYKQYISSQMRKFKVELPVSNDEYNSAFLKSLMSNDDSDNDNSINSNDFDNIMRSIFRENVEIDYGGENYEKIDVPDFREERSGRFIHDFNTNITGIIDLTGKRCFVMPLNRDNVLPPRSLFDLVQKMWNGYYKVDTQVVRETMRVVTPPLKDLKSIGNYIASECADKPVYKLEKFVGGVVKRSANARVEARFAQFSGNKIMEYDIVNFDTLEALEKEESQ